MFQTELIAGSGTSAVNLDLQQEIPVSINLSIADVRNPDKRNGAFSKTIKLYGTKTNNQFFEHIYEVNIVTSTFNRNLKTPCFIKQDGVIVVSGNLRLLSIQKVLQNDIEEIIYDVSILGEVSTLFNEIGDSKLEDLDLSAYNHTYSRYTQYSTWTATKGTGYVYPIIDYGYNAFATNLFKVQWLRPAIYVKQYVDSIFAAAGKTYTSSFFNTSFFKSLIIPHNGDKFTMNSTFKTAFECYVGMSGSGAATNFPLVYVPTFNGWYDPIGSYDIIHNDDTSNPFFDTGGNYNTTTGVISPTCVNGTYNIAVDLKVDVKFNSSNPNFAQTGNHPILKINLYKRANNTSSWFWVDMQQINYPISVTLTSSYLQLNAPVLFANKTAWVGNEFKIVATLITGGLYWSLEDNLNNPITTGTASFDIRVNAASSFKFTLASADYVNGQTINMTDAIPKDIKQKDFLTSLVKMFNLYVDVDKSDNNNYLIEPRNDFYSAGSTLDWSDKLAWDRPYTIKPMAEVDYKRFIYKYKDDSDYYNKKYLESQAETYAQKTFDIINDWTKNENKTEVIFSASPVVDNPFNDLVIPKIFQYDGTTVKPAKHNLRILMFNGVVSNSIPYKYSSPTPDVLTSVFNTTTNEYEASLTSYGQAAMVDNTANPTESIEFGVPNEVYYSPTTYTNNNLYNKYYSRFMNEITDRDSSIVTAYFKLDPQDVANFDFRNRVFVKDSYFLVNSIIDYNPLANDLTKVELLKIKNYSDFEPTISEVGVIETNVGNIGITARVFGLSDGETNIGNANNVLIGSSNRTSSQGSFVSGDSNVIGLDSYRVTIVSCDNTVVGSSVSGCTVTNSSGCIVSDSCYNVSLSNCQDVYVEGGVHDFVGVNLSGVTISTADNGTVRMGNQAPEEMGWVTKTANFNVDPSIQAYKIDKTGGDITALFDFTTCANKTFYFKIIDSTTNLFKIDEISGSPLVDGNAIPYDTGAAQWDNFKVSNDGTNFIIL